MKKILILLFLLLSLSGKAREIKTYSGSFPSPGWLDMSDVTATYDYYEDEDFSRIYHGPFVLKFYGPESNGKKRAGSLKGQFKNGYFDGDWILVYSFFDVKFNQVTRRTEYIPFTATLKCSFSGGELNGPFEIVITNGANKIVARTTINYLNGRRHGEFKHFNAMGISNDEDIQGQYKDGEMVGRWIDNYTSDKGDLKGVYTYDDDGLMLSGFSIDPETGGKIDSYLNVEDFSYGGGGRGKVTMGDLFGAIKYVSNGNVSKEPDNMSYTTEVSSAQPSSPRQEEDVDARIYTSVERMPSFPGGDAELIKYIDAHLRYPTAAIENGVQGLVVVQFVVKKDGSIGEVKVTRGKDPDLDKEAVRVVKTLPNFIPGKNNGQPVNVWFTLPVKFRLPTK